VSGTAALPALRGHEHWVRSVAFSPDGTWVVSGSRSSVYGMQSQVLNSKFYEGTSVGFCQSHFPLTALGLQTRPSGSGIQNRVLKFSQYCRDTSIGFHFLLLEQALSLHPSTKQFVFGEQIWVVQLSLLSEGTRIGFGLSLSPQMASKLCLARMVIWVCGKQHLVSKFKFWHCGDMKIWYIHFKRNSDSAKLKRQ
jgi:WD40 repeat protein